MADNLANPAHDMLADDELVARALEGDRLAFERIIRRHWEYVWRVSSSLSHGDRGFAEDVVQTTFMRAYENLHRFRGDGSQRPGELRPWLLRICRNAAIDGLRRQRRERDRAVALDGPAGPRAGNLLTPRVAPGGSAEDFTVTAVDMEAALAALNQEERAAFLMVKVHGFSSAEAAEITATSPSTIRSRVARARAKLLASLDEH